MKAVLCTQCADVVAPYTAPCWSRSWRWCQCGAVATRWRDGDAGVIEVGSAFGPQHIRVIGFNNLFLGAACMPPERTHEQWRALHGWAAGEVGTGYLFHTTRRNCWAVVIDIDETTDVIYIPGIPPGTPTRTRTRGTTEGPPE